MKVLTLNEGHELHEVALVHSRDTQVVPIGYHQHKLRADTRLNHGCEYCDRVADGEPLAAGQAKVLWRE